MGTDSFGRWGRVAVWATIVGTLGLSGCNGSDGNDTSADSGNTPPVDNPTFATRIQRTEYGIPHITADNYKGLGYGVGYSIAQDNICSLAREIVSARGESALYLGVNAGNIANDIFYTWYNDEARRRELLAAQPQQVRDAIQGYAAGYSRYLRDTGVANIDAACAGKPWVSEIDAIDLAALYNKSNLRGGLSNFVGPMVAAAPPEATAMAARTSGDDVEFDMSRINVSNGGSNAYGLGSDVTENGRGMLYGNPHEPWNGVQRFYEMHLTLPGELDVMGVAQQGQPFPNIGFNKDIAWSHTVSTAKRFTLYQLQLVPGDPLKYRYENDEGTIEQRDIEKVDVTIQLPGDQTRTGTVYLSHYGPMIAANLVNGALPTWGDNNLAFSIRDAASENPRGIQQWLSMDKATSIDDLVSRLKTTLGLPFVNTIAADRYGNAMYADLSTVPHVTAAQFASCIDGQPFLQALAAQGVAALDGSTADCEWGNDADSPQPGIFGGSNLPVLIRDDYVTNSNDSYWLSNPDEPLLGYSPLLRRNLLPRPDVSVPEASPRSLRTRMGLVQVQDRLSGADGLGGNEFTLDNLQTVVYGNRSYAAERVLDDVLADCLADPQLPLSGGETIDGTAACTALNSWDRRDNIDSQGAHVFREFWERVPFRENVDSIFNVGFDENDAVNTPRGLVINDTTRQALGDAIKLFADRGVAFDETLGELQYVVDEAKGDARIPMHGGLGREGVFNVAQGPGPDANGEYTPITVGPTYMQTVTFDDDGPVAEALLAYSQSPDPERPFHRDQTRRYSAKQWIALPFSADEIADQAIGEVLELSE